jgi:hypothetical protein
MRPLRILVPILVLATASVLAAPGAVLGATTKSFPAPTVAASPICDGSWKYVVSPSPSSFSHNLFDVSASTSNEAWAVGGYNTSVGGTATLAEHWNGSGWSAIKSVDVGDAGLDYFLGVLDVSSKDVWAVGYYYSLLASNTLTEHWDGRRWLVVSSPNVGRLNNFLSGVGGDFSTDVWAVGSYSDVATGYSRTLALHWNGRAWTVASTPNVGIGSNSLASVSVRSPSEAWAVGRWSDTSSNSHTLILHWDGRRWSQIASPDPPPPAYNVGLGGVSATSSSDVWAVGSYSNSSGGNNTLIEHWDGAAWTITPSPNPGGFNNVLSRVSATSSTDSWAAGSWNPGYPTYFDQTLVLHWDGSAWSVVPSPNPSTSHNYLYGISATSASDVLAVGTYTSGAYQDRTLTERLC